MKLTRYGKKEILLAVLLSAFFSLLFCFIYLPLILLPVLCCLFVLFFFRDPRRNVPEDSDLFVSPADGRVVAVDLAEENTYIQSKSQRVCIFLSLTNVHLNRIPCAGTIEKIVYTPGKFLNALRNRSSVENENNLVGIRSSGGMKVSVKQIAGTIARRIVCELKPGDRKKTGETFGMIKFGSRTEIYLPESETIEILVTPGQKVLAGETIIARLKS